MSDPSAESTMAQRGVRGIWEGALWGAALGVVRGLIKVVRGAEDAWVQTGASILVGVVLGVIICGIGRAISGRIPGAFVGAIAGLFAGLYIGDELFDYYWVTEPGTETETGRSVTLVGIPLVQVISSGVGLVLGATCGAIVEKVVRSRAGRARSSSEAGS